jgi:phosphoserine phosphatase
MDFTLILVARDILRLDHLAILERWLDENVVRFSTKPSWLAPQVAAQIAIDDYLRPEQMEALRNLYDSHAIDVFITPSKDRCKKILFCDMEATIIREEILDELAKILNIEDKILPITQAAMAGDIDFATALTQRVELLKNTPLDTLHAIAKKLTPNKGAAELVRVLKFYNIPSILVSGGFTFFTAKIAATLDFSAHHGNELVIENDVLTGAVKPPILDRAAKANFIHRYCIEMQITPDQTAAVGDGANDADMISLSGMGVGFHPKPYLGNITLNHIRHTDLSSLLYIFGFTWQDIEKALSHDITTQSF